MYSETLKFKEGKRLRVQCQLLNSGGTSMRPPRTKPDNAGLHSTLGSLQWHYYSAPSESIIGIVLVVCFNSLESIHEMIKNEFCYVCLQNWVVEFAGQRRSMHNSEVYTAYGAVRECVGNGWVTV